MVDTKVLRKISFFDNLNDNELKVMADITARKEFDDGDIIIEENEDGNSLYIIKKGEAKVCKTSSDGEQFTLMMMKDGDIFGEMSFLDGRARTATVMAVTDMEIFVIEKSDFEKIVDDNPRLIYKIFTNLALSIHTIVRGMNTKYLEMLNYMWGRKRG